ncbi:hypothetical protein D3C85_1460660 [compost metagenome]
MRMLASAMPGTAMWRLATGVSPVSATSLSSGGSAAALWLIWSIYDSSEICTTKAPASTALREVSLRTPCFRCTETATIGGSAVTMVK